MTDENAFVQKLIAESKKLTEANTRKCESERILKELTMFQNLSSVCKLDRSAITEKVFRITCKVLPGLHCTENSCSEIVTIALENISTSFTFNPSYWQFVIDIGSGRQVSSWSVENALGPGKTERFSSSFATNCVSAPLEINLGLIFSINFAGQTFVKTFNLNTLFIDVLYLLSPARISREQMFDSHSASSKSSFFTDTDLANTSIEGRKFPSVTQFFLKFDNVLLKYFLEQILLTDSKERFVGADIQCFTSNSVFSVLYQEEEIIVKYKLDTGSVSFKCSNSSVLGSLKSAIFTRLMLIKNIKVKSPEDGVCEKLYSLKLRLEEISKPRHGGISDSGGLMDLYLELRDVSEAVQFMLLNDVD